MLNVGVDDAKGCDLLYVMHLAKRNSSSSLVSVPSILLWIAAPSSSEKDVGFISAVIDALAEIGDREGRFCYKHKFGGILARIMAQRLY